MNLWSRDHKLELWDLFIWFSGYYFPPLNELPILKNSTIRRLKGKKKVRSLASPEKKEKKKEKTLRLGTCGPGLYLGDFAAAPSRDRTCSVLHHSPTTPYYITVPVPAPFTLFHARLDPVSLRVGHSALVQQLLVQERNLKPRDIK